MSLHVFPEAALYRPRAFSVLLFPEWRAAAMPLLYSPSRRFKYLSPANRRGEYFNYAYELLMKRGASIVDIDANIT